jgi:hypothetical protein
MNTQSGQIGVSGTNAADTNYIMNPYPFKVRVSAITILPKTAVSTHASNYITTSIKKASATLAAHTTNSSGGSALAAGSVKGLSVTGTGLDLEIDAGGVITVEVANAGTGPAYNHQVVVQFTPIRDLT